MDAIFWTGLFLGALLGLIGSILGNLWTDPIRELLNKRRQIRYSKKRSQELARYHLAKLIREGDPTSKAVLDIDMHYSIVAIVSLVLTSVYAAIGTGLAVTPALHDFRPFFTIFASINLLAVLLSSIVVLLFQSEIRQLRNRLARFEDYERNIVEKWGPELK